MSPSRSSSWLTLLSTAALVISGANVATAATNACLDPENDNYQCEVGQGSIWFDDCTMGDEDIEDVAECLDNIGRASVTGIRMRRNTFTTFPVGMFEGLVNLEVIEAGQNRLTSLPVGVFDGLESLVHIYLYQNQIKSLQAGVFDGLGSLEQIRLEINHIESLDEGVFDGLDALQTLQLADNKIASVPVGYFAHLGALEYLKLSANSLTSVPVGAFDGLDALKILFLRNNEDLLSLHEGLFDGLHALQMLYLNNIGLQSIPVGLFNGLESLQYLYLEDNMITAIPAGLFDGLPELYILDMSNNDDLECAPSLPGSPLITEDRGFVLPDDYEDGGICSCDLPASSVGACESEESCTPGVDGYTCSSNVEETEPTPEPTTVSDETVPTPEPTPATVEAEPTPEPTSATGDETCGTYTDIVGIVGSNSVSTACCPVGCGTCGGAGCGRDKPDGLGVADCCIRRIVINQTYCSEAGATAPCIIDDGDQASAVVADANEEADTQDEGSEDTAAAPGAFFRSGSLHTAAAAAAAIAFGAVSCATQLLSGL